MKKYLFTILFATLFSFVIKAETSLVVSYLSQDESEYALSLIGRIEIKDEVFRLVSVAGEELASCPLYDVRKLTFGQFEGTDIDDQEQTNQVLFFPNPTTDVLFVNGLKSNETIRLYSLDGQFIAAYSASESGDLQIQVANLAQGTYLLQVGIQIVKFIKQ